MLSGTLVSFSASSLGNSGGDDHHQITHYWSVAFDDARHLLTHLASDSSATAGGLDLTVDAALCHSVVHTTVPSETLAVALALLTAVSQTTVVSSRESTAHVKVSAAAD